VLFYFDLYLGYIKPIKFRNLNFDNSFRRRNVMRLAKKALAIVLTMMTLLVALSAQTPRSEKDNRNLAPTVGTGGPVGGPTGLFTVYDGQTLRKGEYTFSAAYSNYDRDPGNVDITSVPLSFNVGLNDNFELFFSTEAYRGVKVNTPENLSGFYLPNSQLRGGNTFRSAGAIILAPQGPGTSQYTNIAVFRPVQNMMNFGQPFVQFPYVGGAMGNFGFTLPSPNVTSGSIFGYSTFTPTISAPRAGGNGADLFPGLGSTYGGILPGIVLQTVNLTAGPLGSGSNTAPTAFTIAPTYLPDAPFLNRQFGESAFNSFTGGAKWRWTSPENQVGVGVVAAYRWYSDTASDASGFNQLQRGASPGGNRGDIGLTLFADTRLRKWLNVSANVGYWYNSSAKGEFPNGTFTILDRPDELQAAVGVDMPINRYFQIIGEARTNQYVGGRTPNSFENSPFDLLGGIRVFPTRWMGFGVAYRYHANQQDRDSLEDKNFNAVALVGGRTTGASAFTVSGGVPSVFRTSNDPHGYIIQGFVGRRNDRGTPPEPKEVANVTDIELSDVEVVTPCPSGTVSTSNSCNDNQSVNVKPVVENKSGDTLVYDYVVSGGRVVGSGSNVSWDLSGVKEGTYTITSKVDNGCGFCGTTKTKTITVKKCIDCEKPCSCPTVSVSTSANAVRNNETVTFTSNVSGGGDCSTNYNWEVTNGTIESGQGTSMITVKATGNAGERVSARMTGSGDCFCKDSCERNASAFVEIEAPPTPPTKRTVDNLGPAVPDDVKNRLMNISNSELGSDPTATLYILNTGSAKERAKRAKDLNKALNDPVLNLPKDRIIIVDKGGSGPINSEFVIVPAGAEPPM
jgi:hypothetical protein